MDIEGFTESGFCWRFMGHRDRSFVVAIVVPGPGVRNAQRSSRWPRPVVQPDNPPAGSVVAGVGGERVERQLGLIALAQQHSERAIAVAAVLRRVREAAA
jgi:hypothetical protein